MVSQLLSSMQSHCTNKTQTTWCRLYTRTYSVKAIEWTSQYLVHTQCIIQMQKRTGYITRTWRPTLSLVPSPGDWRVCSLKEEIFPVICVILTVTQHGVLIWSEYMLFYRLITYPRHHITLRYTIITLPDMWVKVCWHCPLKITKCAIVLIYNKKYRHFKALRNVL